MSSAVHQMVSVVSETSLAAVITNAYGPDKLSIDQVVYYMSTRPAELMRLDAGVLEVGKPADITVFSTTEEWTVDRNKFYTKGKVSPFDGDDCYRWGKTHSS